MAPMITPFPSMNAPDRATVLTAAENAAEWKLSPDTVQRLFVDEPDVFAPNGTTPANVSRI
jgi:hypothetical protein